jgi:hypothetical protein
MMSSGDLSPATAVEMWIKLWTVWRKPPNSATYKRFIERVAKARENAGKSGCLWKYSKMFSLYYFLPL